MIAKRVTISTEVDETTARAIEEGLDRFNKLHAGPDPMKPLWVVCHDDHGGVSGGLQGFVQWDWLFISTLWVREEYRGLGIGTRLLAAAEDTARQQGCTRVRLGTVTFQAPEFYKKFGYVEICRLPDVPPGHAFIWMSKNLLT